MTSGDDTLYGGEGDDELHGGAGNDYIHGDEDDDYLYGASGEDTLWGGEGSDYIWTGTGWDTVFGDAGCDEIYLQDGGDVVWGGDCDPSDPDENNDEQVMTIIGTGKDPENYTVIMDFWHETAMPFNKLCFYPDLQLGNGTDQCQNPIADPCMTASDIVSGRGPLDYDEPERLRSSGCKNDGGPLWISIDFAEITDEPTAIYARIFQKKQAPVKRRASRRGRGRYA